MFYLWLIINEKYSLPDNNIFKFVFTKHKEKIFNE